MILNLTELSSDPLHEQISVQLLRRIVSGDYEPGHELVPARALASRQHVSVSSVARAYDALECRDFARADFRLDAAGRPHFLEMNPLPTVAPDGSFAILAELAGQSLEDLLAGVFGDGLHRLGLLESGASMSKGAQR